MLAAASLKFFYREILNEEMGKIKIQKKLWNSQFPGPCDSFSGTKISIISQSYVASDVSIGYRATVGGIVGHLSSAGRIVNSYSKAYVRGESNV